VCTWVAYCLKEQSQWTSILDEISKVGMNQSLPVRVVTFLSARPKNGEKGYIIEKKVSDGLFTEVEHNM
jgi:hypothetical protein